MLGCLRTQSSHDKPVSHSREVRQQFVQDRVEPVQMRALLSCNELVSQPGDVLLVRTFGLGQSKQLNVAYEVVVYF